MHGELTRHRARADVVMLDAPHNGNYTPALACWAALAAAGLTASALLIRRGYPGLSDAAGHHSTVRLGRRLFDIHFDGLLGHGDPLAMLANRLVRRAIT